MMHITISQNQFNEVWNHLLPADDQREHVAFMFADFMRRSDSSHLVVQGSRLITGAEYIKQRSDYLELSDDARITIIKQAHQSSRALIELHSHPFPGKWAAAFSLADMNGFKHTVPNMLWRLPNRPYTAIVVAHSGFDALTWHEPNKPQSIVGLLIDQKVLSPTNFTFGVKK